MKNSDYIKVVRLLVLISIITFLCFAVMLAFGVDNLGVPESLINSYKAYSEQNINVNLVVTQLVIDIAIFFLFLISYIYVWQLKIYGVYLFFIATILWWLRLLLIVNVDLTSSILTIVMRLSEYTYISAVVLTWVYNKNIRNDI